MKILISIVLALTTSSCQWIMTHPVEDAEMVQLGEQAVEDLWNYETKTLSPTPPQPNAEPIGPTQPN